jgi:hypothetical protein
MSDKKVKIYVTLDTIFENENVSYLINNNLAIVNKLFIDSLEKISKNFYKLIDIIFISKEKNEKIDSYIKNLDINFKYELKYADNNEILKLHNRFTKDYVLIDSNDELLIEWTKLYGKAIKYTDTKKPKKFFYEFLEIKNNCLSSDDYYYKLVNYIHLC